MQCNLSPYQLFCLFDPTAIKPRLCTKQLYMQKLELAQMGTQFANKYEQENLLGT